MSIVLVLLFALAGSLHARQQREYYFRTLDIRNGLSQNSVTAILQDRRGFMWFGTKEGLNRYDGVRFKVFRRGASGLRNSYITTLAEAPDGRLWIGTDTGISIYDPERETFSPLRATTPEGEAIGLSVTQIETCPDGGAWMAADFQGLFRYDPQTQTLDNRLPTGNRRKDTRRIPNVSHFWNSGGTYWVGLYDDNLYYSEDSCRTLTPFRDADGREPFKGERVTASVEGRHNRRYIGSAGGLTELNLTNRRTRRLIDGYVRALCFGTDGELWVGTENGLYIYDPDSGDLRHLTAPATGDAYALADNAVYAICRDSEGGMWTGTYFGGVCHHAYPHTLFEKFYPERNRGFGKRVSRFCETPDGRLWIGTEDCGLFWMDGTGDSIHAFGHPGIARNVHGLCADGRRLWVGTYNGGLACIDLTGGRVTRYLKGGRPGELNTNDIFTVEKTTGGTLWVGTIHGLMTREAEGGGFEPVPQLEGRNIYDILEDSQGDIWVATYADGVYRYDIRRQTWKAYRNDPEDPMSLPYNKVTGLYEDSRRRLWLLTQGGGVCRYLPHREGFERFGTEEGMPSNTAYCMLEDDRHRLWISTNGGLACFDPDSRSIRTYTTDDGLTTNQFNYQSGHKDREGRLYFGCIDGFVRFAPETFTESGFVPPVVITGLELEGRPVGAGTPGSPLERNICFADRLELEADQNSFALQVAALGYQSASAHRLVYRLEGLDREWHDVGEAHTINYSHLPPGNYLLRLRNARRPQAGADSERTLLIRVRPPVWLTGWAKAAYACLTLLAGAALLVALHRRYRRKQQELIGRIEREKERDLYNAKINFFTNVTHEIRTPLTLIKAPLESILAAPEGIPAAVHADLRIMDMNTNRLLNLVNQLLDFRKAETQGIRLQPARCRIDSLLREMYERFGPLAAQRGVDCTLRADGEVTASVDVEALTKIVSNLMTNAIKYSESRVTLDLRREKEGGFVLDVCNDGPKIPEEMRQEIFKPFVRYNGKKDGNRPGTGIGLPLARRLAELHHGTLELDPQAELNRFVLRIPAGEAAQQPATPLCGPASDGGEAMETAIGEAAGGKRPTLMVVEDNDEMRAFIVRQLQAAYRVLEAGNGKRALEQLEEEEADLVVTDVMMPEMDGMELCDRIKQSLEYCHIPVVMLTAKAALEAKIDGLKCGADAYMEKPFSVELLRATVANLLESREKLREAYCRQPFVAAKSVGMNKADREFLQRLAQVVEEHLQDPQFGLEQMAEQLNVSASTLHRKVKGTLDMTPNNYIRLERLKKAATLFREGNHRINEVCYMVGFSTPSYFAQCFQKQFGVGPKEFINN